MARSPDRERQEAFVEALLGAAEGNPIKAKKMAGYPDSTSSRQIMKTLDLDLVKEVQTMMTLQAARASIALSKVIEEPTMLGASNLIKAADSILDRIGIVKRSEIQIEDNRPSPVLILPPKATD